MRYPLKYLVLEAEKKSKLDWVGCVNFVSVGWVADGG